MTTGRAAPVWAWFLSFTLVWTACVVIGWRLALVPEALRPAFRAGIWLAAVALWLKWQGPISPSRWLGLWPISPTQVGWAALGFGLVFGGNLLRVSAGRLDLSVLALAPETYLRIVVGVFVEELVFRGVLQTRLVEVISPKLAIVLAAVAFLAIHVPGWLILQIPVGPGAAFSTFLIGYFCGGLRYASRSLWPAVAAHLANNLGAML